MLGHILSPAPAEPRHHLGVGPASTGWPVGPNARCQKSLLCFPPGGITIGVNARVRGTSGAVGRIDADTKQSPSHFMRTQQFVLLAANCVYLIALAATAYFTRATARRVGGALIGGVSVGIVGVGVEALAHTQGWWRYPSVETPYGPPLMYPALVLLFATLALIGWRVTRRFGLRGQAVFLGVLAVLGTVRDYLWAARSPELIVFAPGISPVLVDAACWASMVGLAQATMRWVAGPS